MNFKLNEIKIEKAIDLFTQYSKTERCIKETEERENRKLYFNNLLKKPFDEAVFSDIIKKLWASQIWGNKDYLVDKIIKDNDINLLQEKFKLLSNKDIPPEEKYNSFINSIKGMGPSMVTELICLVEPKKAGIWNGKAREALQWLEAIQLPLDKYRITGTEYKIVNEYLDIISTKLKKAGFTDSDLLLVDYLLWEVWDKYSKTVKQESITQKSSIKSKSRHYELINKLIEIGSWLGFSVESEKSIAIGARVDAVWKAKIANLSSVSYVFEVQDKGSIDSLILNLQKSQRNPTVQKLVIVSDFKQLEKIKAEIETMPETFRKSCTYWSDEEVDKTHQSLEQVSNSITRLNLIND
jgi:hypothetical protein